MNSDTYQHKKVTGGSDTAGEEMETGKDISNVSRKHTILIMAGSLLALLFWIAMSNHSGGARGGQYATASGDGMTHEGGGAVAADLFKLGSKVEYPNDSCGPDCETLVEKVFYASDKAPMCEKNDYNTINGVEYCFGPCNLYGCDSSSLAGKGLTGVATRYTDSFWDTCEPEYCRTSNGHGDTTWGTVDVCPSNGSWDYASYLCRKCPKYNVPKPNTSNMCDSNGSWKDEEGVEYCWSTCSLASGNRSCSSRKGFWKLGSCQIQPCDSAGNHRNLCQKV